MGLEWQGSPGQAKGMTEGSRKESNSWLEPRVGRVESESEVPEGSEARSRVHGTSPPQLASRPPDEHVVACWVDHPVVSLPRVVVVPRHLHITIREYRNLSFNFDLKGCICLFVKL